MKNPQYIVYGIIAAILIGFLAISSYRQQWLQEEISKEVDGQQGVEVREEVIETKQLTDHVVFKKYESYQLVEGDGGKIRVKLPSELDVVGADTREEGVLFRATLRGDLGYMVDSASLNFFQAKPRDREKYVNDPDMKVIRIGSQEVFYYTDFHKDSITERDAVSTSFFFLPSSYSMSCSTIGPQYKEYLDMCLDIFMNDVTIHP